MDTVRTVDHNQAQVHPLGLVDKDWHFNFSLPWNKIPTEMMQKLKNKERPKKNERLQMIKLMVSEIIKCFPFPGIIQGCNLTDKLLAVGTTPLSSSS